MTFNGKSLEVSPTIVLTQVVTPCIRLKPLHTVKRQNLVENGILKSRKKAPPEHRINGSLYQMIEKKTMQRISSYGNWTYLRDGLTGEELKASEALSLAKRCGLFQRNNFRSQN